MILWILLGALYLTLFVLLGLATFRKGHYVLFFIGIVFPVLWIIGALLGPTQSAQAPVCADAPAALAPLTRNPLSAVRRWSHMGSSCSSTGRRSRAT